MSDDRIANPPPAPVSHRQLVSASIALFSSQNFGWTSPFYSLGYRLQSLETRVTTPYGQVLRTDLVVLDSTQGHVLLIDCKTSGPLLLQESSEQIRRYFLVQSEAVVFATGLQVSESPLRVNSVFFTLVDATSDLISILPPPSERKNDGWGIAEFTESAVKCVHDEFSDSRLANAFSEMTGLGLFDLPLELLPYERDCPHWELADAIFPVILRLFVQGIRQFSASEIAQQSNPMWQYVTDDHPFVTERIRMLIKRLRRTALKGWIVRVSTKGGEESQWRFSKTRSANRNVLAAFQRRHIRYVSMERTGSHPTAKDFEGIDQEQLLLPATFMQQVEQQEFPEDS